MKTGRRNVNDMCIFWIVVLKIFVQRQQVNIMHRDVVVVVLCGQKPDVNQRRSIESKSVHLIYHKNMMWNALLVQELMHMWDKLQQLFKAIPKWDDQGEFLLPRILRINVFVLSGILVILAAARI